MAGYTPGVVFVLGMLAGIAVALALFVLALSVILAEPLFGREGGLRGRPCDANYPKYRRPGRRDYPGEDAIRRQLNLGYLGNSSRCLRSDDKYILPSSLPVENPKGARVPQPYVGGGRADEPGL